MKVRQQEPTSSHLNLPAARAELARLGGCPALGNHAERNYCYLFSPIDHNAFHAYDFW